MSHPDMSNSSQNTASKIVLAIELSNPSAAPGAHAAAVFACDGHTQTLIGSMPIPADIRSSDGIMVLIEALCKAHQIKPMMITKIIVSIGPGGYTALRIAATTAKVLAHSIGCELVAVDTARVAAQAIQPARLPVIIALASKNQQAHGSLVHPDGRIESLGVISSDILDTYSGNDQIKSLVADGHLPSSFAERAHELGIEIVPIELDENRPWAC